MAVAFYVFALPYSKLIFSIVLPLDRRLFTVPFGIFRIRDISLTEKSSM